jgi:membrane-bound lytic murein transglycosylase
MRFSHSSLFGLTTLIATSFLHGANSAPSFHNTASLSRDSLPLTNDVNSFTKMSLAGRDMNNDILHHELNKRDKKTKKHKKKSKNHKKKKTKKSKAKSSAKKSTTSKASSSSKSSSGSGSYEFSGDGTYYNTGLGSCGITSKDTDLIAALVSLTLILLYLF